MVVISMSSEEANIKEVRGLKLYKKKHKIIKKLLKDTSVPEIHGDKVWFSSYLIMDYLLENPPKKKSRIMEIGSGWGILSIYCAKVYKANVIAVDADKNVFPFLDVHAELNNTKVISKVSRYEKLKASLLAEQNLILGGDICFWNELIDPLHKLIKKSLKNSVETIVIADPGRSPFLKLAKKCKNKFDAELIEVELEDPLSEEGYLLVIKN